MELPVFSVAGRAIAALWLLAACAFAADPREALTPREWTVEGVVRHGFVHIPATAKGTPSPVVFVFHGHGGTAAGAARQFGLERHWPAAIVVYLQGLNTPGRLSDPEGKKPGWQHSAGAQGDRDLQLFDTVLAGLKKDFRVDAKRIYATGHSNGGAFTYLLWRTRGEVFAALAPSAAALGGAGRMLDDAPRKPILHLAGEKDALVKFAWQQRAMGLIREHNGCAPEGRPWAKWSTLYASPTELSVVTFIHPGGHEFPADAPALIVKFFQEHALP